MFHRTGFHRFIAALFSRSRNRKLPSGWQSRTVLFSVVTITGETLTCQPVMRRKTAKGWEYRKMTQAELDDYLDSEAW